MSLYKYAPLIAKGNGIRLLKLLPGQLSEDIEIEIYHAPFSSDKVPEYEALSYVWGSTEDLRTIKIRDASREAAVLTVTQNLEIALQHIRRTDGLRVL
jgi:hypothetical protein